MDTDAQFVRLYFSGMRTIRLAAALLLAAGCGPPGIDYRGAREERAAVEIPELAGTWSGTYTITRESGRAVNVIGQIRATINQRDGVLSGPTQFRQGTLQGNGMISGFISANGSFSWTHTVSLASGGLTYRGTVSPDLMSLQGTFAAFNGSTSGHFGFRREGPPPPPKARPAPPPPPPTAASIADLSGTWRMEVTYADGLRDTSEAVFQQTDRTLTGTIRKVNAGASADVNVRGELHGEGRVAFGYVIRRRAEDPGLRIRFEGKAETGKTIRGRWTVDGGEEGGFVLVR